MNTMQTQSTMKAQLVFAIVAAAGFRCGGNIDASLPQAAKAWAAKQAIGCMALASNVNVLEALAEVLVDSKLKHDASALGL